MRRLENNLANGHPQMLERSHWLFPLVTATP